MLKDAVGNPVGWFSMRVSYVCLMLKFIESVCVSQLGLKFFYIV